MTKLQIGEEIVRAYASGCSDERLRVREELLEIFGPHALITDKMGDRMEPLLEVLDRICPANEGKEE